MAHRAIKSKDFAGKTIVRVDARAVNIIRFYFTDGTAVAIEVDAFGHGIYGMVACDVCVAPKKNRRNLDRGPSKVVGKA